MTQNQVENIFTELGGVFCTSLHEFQKRTGNIKAFIFDWDGVFNDGTKNEQGSSSFSEVDAMGTNMLRFSHYLAKNAMPVTAVMSGEKNVFSFQYGVREHFHGVYFKVKNKRQALDHFLLEQNLKAEEVAFVFDDVLDLSLAEACGLRLLVNREANPLFKNYVIKNDLADYVTANAGGSFAVREVCELLMGMNGNFDETIQNRANFTTLYERYLEERQQIPTTFFTLQNNAIEKTDIKI